MKCVIFCILIDIDDRQALINDPVPLSTVPKLSHVLHATRNVDKEYKTDRWNLVHRSLRVFYCTSVMSLSKDYNIRVT